MIPHHLTLLFVVGLSIPWLLAAAPLVSFNDIKAPHQSPLRNNNIISRRANQASLRRSHLPSNEDDGNNGNDTVFHSNGDIDNGNRLNNSDAIFHTEYARSIASATSAPSPLSSSGSTNTTWLAYGTTITHQLSFAFPNNTISGSIPASALTQSAMSSLINQLIDQARSSSGILGLPTGFPQHNPLSTTTPPPSSVAKLSTTTPTPALSGGSSAAIIPVSTNTQHSGAPLHWRSADKIGSLDFEIPNSVASPRQVILSTPTPDLRPRPT